jgi:exosortase
VNSSATDNRKLEKVGLFLGVGTVVLYWLTLANELRIDWTINSQYNYGWITPLLAAGLFWRRWLIRPAAHPPAVSPVFMVTLAVVLLIFLPIRLVREANPEWRLIYWLHGIQLLTGMGLVFYYLGGWSWMRHFTAPFAFCLVAIPWPMQLETALIQSLMRQIAGWTVLIADGLGIPAMQHGNVIEIKAGLVGIDEACSGVRSLQTALMMSLFLGEFHQLRAWRRVFLVMMSLPVVLLSNLGRTTFLVWTGEHYGLSRLEAWHETAGLVAMLLTLAGVLGLAAALRGRPGRPQPLSFEPWPRAFSRWVPAVCLLWLLLVEGTTELWYRVHETDLRQSVRWSVRWPGDCPEYTTGAIPDRALAMLRCSQSGAAVWSDQEGYRWTGFFLRWDPGENSAQLAKGHVPEICLQATGARLRETLAPTEVSVGSLKLPFQQQLFERDGELFHVFYCHWSDRSVPGKTFEQAEGGRFGRLEAVWAGKRHLGQQVLELALWGAPDSLAATEALKQQVHDLIHVLGVPQEAPVTPLPARL